MDGYDLELTSLFLKMCRQLCFRRCQKVRAFYEAILIGKADAVLASLFHYGELEIMEVKQYLHQKGINVRL